MRCGERRRGVYARVAEANPAGYRAGGPHAGEIYIEQGMHDDYHA